MVEWDTFWTFLIQFIILFTVFILCYGFFMELKKQFRDKKDE